MQNPSPLANPLATPVQLRESGSQLDGIPRDLEDSIRFAGARLTQAAGILLRLPQEVIAQAIIVFARFWVGTEGGSLAEFGAAVSCLKAVITPIANALPQQVSAASIYLTTKLSAYPKSPRSIINVYAYLSSFPTTYLSDPSTLHDQPSPNTYYITESAYQMRKDNLFDTEQRILKTLGFQLHVSLPYALCITYLQALDIFSHPRASELAKRATAHLNTGLLSPQMLYLTHQPTSLATAAIYLAARETGFRLPDVEWWEVFDTDREELGFLVVAFLSVEGFAEEERRIWEGRKVPMSVEAVEAEMQRRDRDGEN